MATLRPISEHAPLIEPTRYNELHDTTKKGPKPVAYALAVIGIITAGLIIYAFSMHSPSPSGTIVHNHQWAQMEPDHALVGYVPPNWEEADICHDDHQFTLTLAIKQSNIDQLHDELMKVSHPKHADTFRKYWSKEQVRSFFAPKKETIDAVTEWLGTHGLTPESGKISLSTEHGFIIRVSLTCSEANDLLNTQYMFYEHSVSGQSQLRVRDGVYHIPTSIVDHIDFVEPTIRFPVTHHQKEMTKLELSAEQIEALKAGEQGEDQQGDDVQQHSSVYNTPIRLYQMYGMTDDILSKLTSSDKDVRQAIASYIEEYYMDTDLELAWSTLGYAGNNDIDEMIRFPETQPQGDGSEAELDTQYITATGTGLDTYVYYIDDDSDSFVTLVEYIMESEVMPNVVSISYGGDEYEFGEAYAVRINQEFGKLGLMGVTVLASSGDSGALGDDSDCYGGTEYVASFPASASYVTAVGGTHYGSTITVEDEGSEYQTTGEVAWSYSGGTFSIYFETPEWQQSAYDNYFNQDIQYPKASRYTANMRGLPDISAQSVAYIVAVDGSFWSVSGTSCSSPAVAGMISMMNVARAEEGKAALGFLNPALYAVYDSQDNFNQYFNDVAMGYNEGCSVDSNVAWYAASGWDPITGVGTPKFNEMLEQLNALEE